MIFSLFYFFSQTALVVTFLLYPKTNSKLPLFLWAIPTLILPEVFACSVGGIFTAVGLPADIITIGVTNFAVAIFLAFKIKKKGSKVQRYYWDWLNGISLVLLAVVAVSIVLLRFTANFNISFETSDPAIHLQMAMDSLRTHSVLSPRTFMFMGNLTNSLFLKFWLPFVGQENLYKIFIIKLCLNWLLDGSMFFCVIRNFFKRPNDHFLSLGISVFYFLGYPLTNLLFGFNYLGFTITIFLFLLFIEQQRAEKLLPIWMGYVLLSITCFSISVGYIIFAPVAYAAVFISLTWDYWKEKRRWMDFGYIKMQLSVFFFPTLLTLLYYFVLVGDLNKTPNVSSLLAEGYIYRNLYSDFVLMAPFAIMGFLVLVQKRKAQNNTLMCVATGAGLETLLFVFLLMQEKISSYYYFKINFLLWLVIWLLVAVAMSYFFENLKIAIPAIASAWMITFGMFFFQVEKGINEKSIQVTPFEYTMSETWMRDYDFNRFLLKKDRYDENKTNLNLKLSELLHLHSGKIVFVGYWLDYYWCEAITDTQEDVLVQQTDNILKGINRINGAESGDYIVLQKSLENFSDYYETIDKVADAVWENDIGYIFVIR